MRTILRIIVLLWAVAVIIRSLAMAPASTDIAYSTGYNTGRTAAMCLAAAIAFLTARSLFRSAQNR